MVGRLVRVCAQGRACGHSVAGLLPHQHPEHGAVRTHTHHRRRRLLRALRGGCTAPIYSTDSLHAAIVEIIVEKNARVRYTTVQNWSNNVYNLVTQRAYVREGATMEWVDGNIGSKATMKYPACILAEPYASASTMSLGFAGKGQYYNTGAKMIHLAPIPLPPSSRSPYREEVGVPPIEDSSRSSTAPKGRALMWCVMRCWSMTSHAPTPTPMWMYARTTSRWPMRRPSRRSPRTSCST